MKDKAVEPSASVRSLIRTGAQMLEARGVESAMLDAEILMAEAAGVARAQVLAETRSDSAGLSPRVVARFGEYVARRAGHEPVAYIVGRKEFFSLDLEVNRAVLIPRPETETLVAAALEFVSGQPEAWVLDMGTGSGAVALAIAANAPGVRIVAADISKESLEVAHRNAERLGVADRIEFRHGDCWAALDGGAPMRFDLVVSNPPYVEDAALETLAPEIREYEPRIALTAGPDGLAFYRRILGRAAKFIRPGGELQVEVGAGQAASVIDMCREAGCTGAVAIRDLAGIERVVRAVI
jgi:release factor glutamine methyltransferase